MKFVRDNANLLKFQEFHLNLSKFYSTKLTMMFKLNFEYKITFVAFRPDH